jgi:DNA helicase-2/ATP-dependent DNA helicase PcrA
VPGREGQGQRIVEEELELLSRINGLLALRVESDSPAEEALVQELLRLREQLVAKPDGKDALALSEQWHRHSSLLRQLRSSRAAPRVDPRSPYFAHLRLEEEGDERDLCLGRATCVEQGMRIVDWRNAPVSRIYYRYEQGDEYEERFAGRVHAGRVLARRSVLIRDAALERIEAPEGIFTPEPAGGWRRAPRRSGRLAGGEGAALRAHGPGAGAESRLAPGAHGARRADKRLAEITALIDPAQFGLIASPDAAFLLIRGAAGSGKTTVALHRIAFLAYEDPAIDSSQTLFVAFSTGLRRYVEHVLPALGVERVAIRTFEDWAREQRRRHYPDLPLEERIDAPAAVRRLKLHPVLDAALEAQARRVAGPATAAQALDDWASVLSQGRLLAEACERAGGGAFGARELELCAEWGRRRNEELFAWLAGDRDAPAALDPEDDALLLRAWQLRVGPLRGAGGRPLAYRHVAVDEVQEFSPLEIRLLMGCLDARRSLTLAGDAQQLVAETGGFGSWSELLAQLGVPGASVETLRVSHRSTREVMDFAFGVLGDLREEDAAPAAGRSGPPVEIFRFAERGACVAFLGEALRRLANEEPLASVAVLTPDAELSELYCAGLEASELPRLRRVADQDFAFAPGVEVTEIEQAKGLEFDYVVLVEVGAEWFPDAPRARRLLHVGATRAVHQLWVTAVGEPSPLLPLEAKAE